MRTYRHALTLGLAVFFVLVTAREMRAEGGLLEFDAVDILQKGGPVMIVILLGSVVGLALAFERALALRKQVLVPQGLAAEVVRLAGEKDAASLKGMLERSPSAMGRILLAGVRRLDHGPKEMERIMETVASHELNRLKRPVRPIALLATIEPLLGLLGTVFGMIATFNVLHATSAADRVSKLAPGIGTALYTTAAGLCVAIPFVLIYHALIGKVNAAAETWSAAGTEMVLSLTDLGAPAVGAQAS